MSLNRLLTRRVRRAALTLCAAAVLSACGGGDRAEPYVPTQLQAYGDELSVIDDSAAVSATNSSGVTSTSAPGNGVKYTVNGFNSTTGLLDCTVNPNWVQILAANLGMAFEECKGTSTNLAAINNASFGAKTADVITKLNTLIAANPGPTTLATVLVGTNDVKDLNAQVNAKQLSLEAALAEAQLRGKDLGAAIKRVTDARIGVVVATLPDLGQSPYALLGTDVNGNPNNSAVIRQLTNAFNEALVLNIPESGRKVGLVYGRPVGMNLNGDPVEGYTNQAICAVGVPQCMANTLQPGSDLNTWIWATDVYPTPITHSKLGNNATTLARNTLAPGQDD
jgi:outer membrane lipase/esterase